MLTLLFHFRNNGSGSDIALIMVYRVPASVLTTVLADLHAPSMLLSTPQAFPWRAASLLQGAVSVPASELQGGGQQQQPAAVLYEVCKVRSGGHILYLDDHVQRFVQGMAKVLLGLPATSTSMCAGGTPWQTELLQAVPALVRQQVAQTDRDASVQQNIKFLAWLLNEEGDGVGGGAGGSSGAGVTVQFAAYFIKSYYPPDAWYMQPQPQAPLDANAAAAPPALLFTTGLAFGIHRPDPNVKQMGHAARSIAAARQKAFNLFETWIVQPDMLVPEGSRSNFVLITNDGQALSSLDADILVGVTLSVLKRCSAVVPLVQRKLTLLDVLQCRAMAMTGTSVGVLPIPAVLVYATADERTVVEAYVRQQMRVQQPVATPSAEATADVDAEAAAAAEVQRVMQRITVSSDGSTGTLLLPSASDAALLELRHVYESQAKQKGAL
jgi:branched-subunit amino acid aminotransferase/4-amino-4-deoxychorismate lyase